MPRLPRVHRLICTAVIAMLLPGLSAPAQDARDGLRAGSFVIAPSVSVGAGYDTNLFLTQSRPVGTMKVVLAPDLLIVSDWSRHALKVEAQAEAGFYTRSSREDYLDAGVRVSAEADVTRKFRIQVSASAMREHDPRSSDDLPVGVVEPVRFVTLDVGLGAEGEIGRFRIAPFAIWRRFDFRDVGLSGGGVADQDNRDRQEVEAGLEIGYAPGRAWELLVRAEVFDIDYRLAGSTAGPARDAMAISALAGVGLKLTRLIEGRITAGIVRHDYDSAALDDITTLAIDAGIDWHPTRRLDVMLDAGRYVSETAVAGAAGRVATRAGLRLAYELRRTLTVDAGGRFFRDKYSGIARTDLGIEIGLGSDWSPMRGVSIRPEYTFARRASNAPGQDYADHLFFLTATYSFGVRK